MVTPGMDHISDVDMNGEHAHAGGRPHRAASVCWLPSQVQALVMATGLFPVMIRVNRHSEQMVMHMQVEGHTGQPQCKQWWNLELQSWVM